ncbi:glycoside hydrolase family 16 protein [Ceratobasidium sp. AG-Ba]|nr:glycoside hydrolase family 16 protein [Ceratobasidium sp. AG-Ba]
MHALFRGLVLLSVATPLALALDSADDFFHGLPRHSQNHRRTKIVLGSYPIWKKTDDYRKDDFFNDFTFEAIPDPTHGRVNYVDKQTAIAHGLATCTPDSFIMRADSTTVLDPAGPGRESIRLQSKKQWTSGVFVLDLKHMPVGCGYWMTQHIGWPQNGEIDVLEGVNDQIPNRSAIHTVNGCSMSTPQSSMTGNIVSTNCSYLNNYNEGCAVLWENRQDSYAKPLNDMGGGWFVTERTDNHVSIWFWGRNDENVPPAVRSGAHIICTKEFGKPIAYWESSNTCNLAKVLGPHNILINLTLCGDWAGQPDVYRASGCPGTCIDNVNNNPGCFKDAYWEINSLRVYSQLHK